MEFIDSKLLEMINKKDQIIRILSYALIFYIKSDQPVTEDPNLIFLFGLIDKLKMKPIFTTEYKLLLRKRILNFESFGLDFVKEVN